MHVNCLHFSNLQRFNIIHKYCYNKYSTQLLHGFPQKYSIKDSENGRYEIWQNNNYFNSEDRNSQAFKMILPPPNITGVLHLGHALTVTIQDILARWHRMKGQPVIWIPGFDHAGSATQVVVEKILKKQRNLTKTDMSKEDFLCFVDEWKSQKENTIRLQLKSLGATLDWSKEYYTMNEAHSHAVTEAFIKLYERKLLYKQKALVNYSHALNSTISDIEIEKLHIKGKTLLNVPGYSKKIAFGEIVEISFKFEDLNKEIVVATTRPETLYGDVAIAVHPQDERYANFIGKQVWHPLREIYIPVIASELVDRNFGTGAVKITPAHDHVDYIIAQEHKLNIINVIDESGNLTDAAKSFVGLKKFNARPKIISKLAECGALQSINDHEVMLPVCSRSGDIIELLIKEQWFLKCNEMAERAIDAVKNNLLKIDPKSSEEKWFDWLKNIKDWCVSRQLLWGHPIPVYYIQLNNNSYKCIVAKSITEAKRISEERYLYKGKVFQDTDVLDTWFSSALLPLSVAGWPNNMNNFKKFYPLSLMETGHDILFFWVAKMVMLGLELTNELPFKNVLCHGLICDNHGKKMSKSAGNVILPEHIIHGLNLKDIQKTVQQTFEAGLITREELKRTKSINEKSFSNGIPECGTDALRMTLCAPHNIKEHSLNFNIMECEANKRFLNKVWQASRFVLGLTDKKEILEPKTLHLVDKWILSRLSFMVDNVNEALEEYQINKAILAMKEFLYKEFCDIYIEATKFLIFNKQAIMQNKTSLKDKEEYEAEILCHIFTLTKCLEVFLRVFAPVAPYFTDDLYLRLSERLSIFSTVPSLLKSSYPTVEEFKIYRDINLEEEVQKARKVIEPLKTIFSYVDKSEAQINIIAQKDEDRLFLEEILGLIKVGIPIKDIQIKTYKNYEPRAGSFYSKFKSDLSMYLDLKNTDKEKNIHLIINEKRNKILKELVDLEDFVKNLPSERKINILKKAKAEAKIKKAKNQLKNIPFIVDSCVAQNN